MKLNFIKTICTNNNEDLNVDVRAEGVIDTLSTITSAVRSLSMIGFSAQQIGALLDAAADTEVNPMTRIEMIIKERDK
jgi:hypothetical protein